MKNAESEILKRALSRDAWSSFPTASGAETWELTLPGEVPRQVTLSKGNLRVFKAIQEAPLYCASRVRISDRVLILKRDYGGNITTHMFKSEHSPSVTGSGSIR